MERTGAGEAAAGGAPAPAAPRASPAQHASGQGQGPAPGQNQGQGQGPAQQAQVYPPQPPRAMPPRGRAPRHARVQPGPYSHRVLREGSAGPQRPAGGDGDSSARQAPARGGPAHGRVGGAATERARPPSAWATRKAYHAGLVGLRMAASRERHGRTGGSAQGARARAAAVGAAAATRAVSARAGAGARAGKGVGEGAGAGAGAARRGMAPASDGDAAYLQLFYQQFYSQQQRKAARQGQRVEEQQQRQQRRQQLLQQQPRGQQQQRQQQPPRAPWGDPGKFAGRSVARSYREHRFSFESGAKNARLRSARDGRTPRAPQRSQSASRAAQDSRALAGKQRRPQTVTAATTAAERLSLAKAIKSARGGAPGGGASASTNARTGAADGEVAHEHVNVGALDVVPAPAPPQTRRNGERAFLRASVSVAPALETQGQTGATGARAPLARGDAGKLAHGPADVVVTHAPGRHLESTRHHRGSKQQQQQQQQQHALGQQQLRYHKQQHRPHSQHEQVYGHAEHAAPYDARHSHARAHRGHAHSQARSRSRLSTSGAGIADKGRMGERGAPVNELSAQLPGYKIGMSIGEGGFCTVRAGVHRLTGAAVAVKVYDKRRLGDPADRRRVGREIRVLKRLASPRVIQLLEVVDAPSRMFMVMERAANGSLLDYVRSRKRLDEPTARKFFCQAVAGIEYCHRHLVVHRDIKLENLLLDENDNLRLIDFGLAAILPPGPPKKLKVHCGSPSYAAPEIVGRTLYDGPPVDVWSLGVVTFAMLAGSLPFHARNNKQELCQKIMRGAFTLPDFISRDAADLLKRMLTVDPSQRITVGGLWSHPWVSGRDAGGLSEGAAASYGGDARGARPGTATAVMMRGSAADARALGYGSGWAGLSSGLGAEPRDSDGTPQALPSHADAIANEALDEDLIRALEGFGYERGAIVGAVSSGEHNYLTASYWLMQQARRRSEAVKSWAADGTQAPSAAMSSGGGVCRPASAPHAAASASAPGAVAESSRTPASAAAGPQCAAAHVRSRAAWGS